MKQNTKSINDIHKKAQLYINTHLGPVMNYQVAGTLYTIVQAHL